MSTCQRLPTAADLGIPCAVSFPESVQRQLQRCLSALRERLPDLEPCGKETGTGAKRPRVSPDHDLVLGPYHISLSRAFPVRYKQIPELVVNLKDELRQGTRRCDSLLLLMHPSHNLSFVLLPTASFEAALDGGWEVFVNDERTRTFLALSLGQGTQETNAMTRRVDSALRPLGLPVYYDDPRPHVSVAWLPGDQRTTLEAMLADMVESFQLEQVSWGFRVEEVLCVTGNKVHRVWASASIKTHHHQTH